MKSVGASPDRKVLNAQCEHWEGMLAKNAEMFGAEGSEPARKAAEAFRKADVLKLLELGGGQGRDTLFFAREGFGVTVLDYAESGVAAIRGKAEAAELEGCVRAIRHDVRDLLPFDEGIFDGCFSHMLFCMAMTTRELKALAAEIRRVLRPGGLCVYTVRHTGDAHYGTGVNKGEDMYEHDGFIVHFFSREKVEALAEGYELVEVEEFEEGDLPRKLWRVTMRRT